MQICYVLATLYIRAPVDSSSFLSLIGLLCLNKGVYLSYRICRIHINDCRVALRINCSHFVQFLNLTLNSSDITNSVL